MGRGVGRGLGVLVWAAAVWAPPALAQPKAILPPVLQADSPAAYPEDLAGEGAGGEVELELHLDEQGAVAGAEVVRGAHPALDAAALRAATGLRFSPALWEGRPVPVRMRFVYRFLPPAPSLAAAAPAPAEEIERRACLVTGLVRSRGNRDPVAGASVTQAGTSVETGPDGRFRLRVAAGERVPVTVKAPGFEARTFVERVEARQEVEVVYALDPLRINPYETVVRGDRPRTEVTRVTLEDQELREVPGTMGDPFRVIMLMPGVSSVASGVAYPVVRGGSPAATGFFLDGVRVPMLFHLYLGPAVVHPDFVEGLDFYPGGAPPQYGRLLGGVIEGRTSRPRDDRIHGTAYLDLINAGAFVEAPIEATGTSVTLAGRYGFTPWLIGAMANAFADPSARSRFVLDFWDYQGRLEQRLFGGKLRLFAFGSSDRAGTEATDPDVAAASQAVAFHRIDARYQHALLGGQLEAGATWGLDDLAFHAQAVGDARTDFSLDEQSWAGRLRWTAQPLDWLELQLGGDVDRRASHVRVGGEMSAAAGLPLDIDQPLAVGAFLGAWAAAVFRYDGWTIVPGGRVDVFHVVPRIERVSADPRVSVRKAIGESVTLKGAAGLYHQAPTTLIQLPVVDLAGVAYGLQEAAQFDLGVEWRILDGLELRLEGYYNPLLRTVEINPFDPSTLAATARVPISPTQIPGPTQVFSAQDLASSGHAYGLEVMLRHPLGGRWFGWLSYSLQRSTRWTRYYRYDPNGTFVSEGAGYLPYAFDQTHVLNVVLSYQLPRGFTVGGAFHFNTGRPESGVMTSSTLAPGSISGRPVWVAVPRDEAERLPPFFRFDLRVSKVFVFDAFTVVTYLDVLNVSFQTEVLAFSYTGGLYRGGGPLARSPVGLPIVLPVLGIKGAY